MKYCPYCGKEVVKGADFCIKCGKLLNNDLKKVNVDDNYVSNPFLFGIIGFFIPIAGLILYCLWKDNEKYIDGKAAGKGALISVSLGLIIWFLLIGLAVIFSTAF